MRMCVTKKLLSIIYLQNYFGGVSFLIIKRYSYPETKYFILRLLEIDLNKYGISGIACRMDLVAEKLNLSAWNGTTFNYRVGEQAIKDMEEAGAELV